MRSERTLSDNAFGYRRPVTYTWTLRAPIQAAEPVVRRSAAACFHRSCDRENPDILLCDEPTGALDYNTSKEILKLIEDVNKKYGNTIIMVTHNEAIRNMADHVIKLRDGAVRHNERNEHKISAADLEW